MKSESKLNQPQNVTVTFKCPMHASKLFLCLFHDMISLLPCQKRACPSVWHKSATHTHIKPAHSTAYHVVHTYTCGYSAALTLTPIARPFSLTEGRLRSPRLLQRTRMQLRRRGCTGEEEGTASKMLKYVTTEARFVGAPSSTRGVRFFSSGGWLWFSSHVSATNRTTHQHE